MIDDEISGGDRDVVLNKECFCVTLDSAGLLSAIQVEARDADLATALLAARPHLFASTPVFIAKTDLAAMLAVVAAVEAAAQGQTTNFRTPGGGFAPVFVI